MVNQKNIFDAAVTMAINYNKAHGKYTHYTILRKRIEDWSRLLPFGGDIETLAALALSGNAMEISSEEVNAIREDYFPDPFENIFFDNIPEKDYLDDPLVFEMETQWMGIC